MKRVVFFLWNLAKNLRVSLREIKTIMKKLCENKHNFHKLNGHKMLINSDPCI